MEVDESTKKMAMATQLAHAQSGRVSKSLPREHGYNEQSRAEILGFVRAERDSSAGSAGGGGGRTEKNDGSANGSLALGRRSSSWRATSSCATSPRASGSWRRTA